MTRYICVHGHFYQPPRENPWLETIELQDSAYPFSDWNARILDECYLPNTCSRVLDEQGHITHLINNYAQMSFNFGPTLLSWMEEWAPRVYNKILEADRESMNNFSGHGSAIAQVYNHMILPLANDRDKTTQIIWGIKDFQHRFKRDPEGMWLSETAVDLKTLTVLVDQGIKFTILSPYQAQRVREIEGTDWLDVGNGSVDPKRPYICRLPCGKSITLFFYDGPISQDIAFGDLLKNGVHFSDRLISAFPEDKSNPLLLNVSNDGETYGHHQKFGNMALTYMIQQVKKNKDAQITIYGEYLEKFPPNYEVEIKENSAWSCSHGIERWKSDCGCNSGMNREWNQKWRAGLRYSMDWLRDKLIDFYVQECSELTEDPWGMRDAYIEIILNRSEESLQRVLNPFFKRKLTSEESSRILNLLEMQRHAMLMYTSCGWFFDDISGIETVQIIEYAARAMQIMKDLGGECLEEEYISKLASAKSNLPEMIDGKQIYERDVKPSVVSLKHVGAHYAIASYFKEVKLNSTVYCYDIESKAHDKFHQKKDHYDVGIAHIKSKITQDQITLDYVILDLGNFDITAVVREHVGMDKYDDMRDTIKESFLNENMTHVLDHIGKYFGQHYYSYSLWDLFFNEQKIVVNNILNGTLQSIEKHHRQIYENHFPLMQMMRNKRMQLPKAVVMSIEFIMNYDLCRYLEGDKVDLNKLTGYVREISNRSLMRDKETVKSKAQKRIGRLMSKLSKHYDDIDLINTISEEIKILMPLDLNLDFWKAQNVFFRVGKKCFSDKSKKNSSASDSKTDTRDELKRAFTTLGDRLNTKILI